MAVLITGIGELTTNDPELGKLRDAALVLDGETVVWAGPAAQAPDADERVDVEGRAVLPGWVDSHTHLVFAGDRTAEFEARMAGQAYAAGGIAVTVDATRAASDEQLAANLRRHVEEAAAQGTTCLETKTGYGLNVVDETRSARIAGEVADEVTFLGAHLVPPGADAESYVDLVCGEMLDAVAPHVRWADVFCETGAFDEAQSARVLKAAAERGLGLRVHGNQLGEGPGVRLAVELDAASVDHCTYLSDADVEALASSNTVATALPACDLSTRQSLAPARRLLDSRRDGRVGEQREPGQFVHHVDGVLRDDGRAADADDRGRGRVVGNGRSGARALRRDDVGYLRPGARADVHVLDAPSTTHLAYRPGVPLTHAVWRKGAKLR